MPNGTGPFQELNPTPGFSNEPVDVEDANLETSLLSIFPNPSSGRVFIEADCQDCQIEIRNVLGQRILEQDFFNQLEWKFDSQVSGTFFVLLKKNSRLIETKKVVLR